MSAVTRTALILSESLVTTMGANVAASQNTVGRICIAVRVGGFATPMGTAVITSTPAGNGIRTGSTTTTTGTDRPKTLPMRRAPLVAGPTHCLCVWRVKLIET